MDHMIFKRFYKILKFTIDFNLRRNQPFYSLTLFIPILVLTLLSPIGLLLPGKTQTISSRYSDIIILSWRWWKNGTSDNSFAFWYYLCWYSSENCSSIWFIWKLSSHFKFFHCINCDADSLLVRNEPNLSQTIWAIWYDPPWDMIHIIAMV